VQELAATEGKRFAVIADEAHSSQTGDAAAKLKQLLSAEEWAELQDGGESIPRPCSPLAWRHAPVATRV
jgi:Type I site-specific restriction-modification system, R (restriction) subunit and related helicases